MGRSIRQSSTPKSLSVVFAAGLYASTGELRQMPDYSEFAKPLSQHFSTELQSAIQAAPLPPLGDGILQKPLVTLLSGGIGDHLIDVPASRHMECLSGLWLVAGDIHRSHSLSQEIGSAEGSFLHGIMHRREGDFGNSKYWFRRVGSHCVFDQIGQETQGRYSDPFDFVDLCQQATRSNTPDRVSQCVADQWIEWQSLMLYLVG